MMIFEFLGRKSITLAQNENLRIFISKFKHWWIYLHDSSIPVSVDFWNAMVLETHSYYTIIYSYQSFQLLKSPFATNCTNYELETPFLSRKDCIRKCKLKRSLDECKVIGFETPVYKNELMVEFAQNEEKKECVKNLNSETFCQKECPNLDCFNTYYRLMKTSQIGMGEGKDYVWVELVLPQEPETTFIHKPRIEMVEFICYMASTVSLWFGFSMFSVLTWFNTIVIKLKQVNYLGSEANIRSRTIKLIR